MKWANENPIQPGWYWYKDKAGTEVVKVGPDRFMKGDMQACFAGIARTINLSFLGGQWLGPLEIPEGPDDVTVNERQRHYLEAMLGCGRQIQKEYHGYRDRYVANVGSQEEEDLLEMTKAGLVKSGVYSNDSTMRSFCSTQKGRAAIGLSEEQYRRGQQ